jgi:hypothetical protein
MHPVIWVAAAAAAYWIWDKSKSAPSSAPSRPQTIAKPSRGEAIPNLTTVVESYVVEDKELQAKAGIKT